MVRRGSRVSSVRVVTASKPRKEYAAMAAPAAIPETVESPFRNGVTEKRLPTPEPATRERTASRTKKTSTRIWKVIRTAFARCATLIPRTLSTVVRTMKASTHRANGTPGNWADRYAAPMSQMTIGRKK
jgi:hypothetical protein